MSTVALSTELFSVSGRDEYHDRGIREFGNCQSATDAAHEYLRAYVEDWRGDFVPRVWLSLRVWRTDEDSQRSTPFLGEALFDRDQHGHVSITYRVQQEDNDAQN